MSRWNEFIRRQALVSGSDSDLEDSAIQLCPLTEYSLISVKDKDNLSFLNNQLSNNLNKLSDNDWMLNAYCNPKGRAYCCLRVFKRGGDHFLRTSEAVSEKVLKRLQMYVLRAEVTLALCDWAGFGLAGAGSDDLVKTLPVKLDEAPNAAAHTDRFSILRLPGPKPRYEIYGVADTIEDLWQKFAPQATAMEAAGWRRLAINAGNPEIYAETSEHFVPQMLNLDLLHGISFSKGCYPGQEVVARIHYRGKLKRRMYHFSAPGIAVSPATPILTCDDPVQAVGEVVDCCSLNPEVSRGLAVLRIEAAETCGDKLRLQSHDGCAIRLEPLPYEISADSFDPEK